MHRDKDIAAARLLAGGWLSEQSPDFQAALIDAGRLASYDTGTYTHHIGDGMGGFYGIVSGAFGAIVENHVNGIVLGTILHCGFWFGYGPLLSGKARTLAFRALEPSVVLHIPLSAIEPLTRRVPRTPLILASLNEYQMTRTHRILSDLLIRRSDQRIAAILLRITGTEAGGHPDGRPDLAVTQTDLAEMANASRHTVNAVLGDFAGRGWVGLGYGKVSVLNRDGLLAFAQRSDLPQRAPA